MVLRAVGLELSDHVGNQQKSLQKLATFEEKPALILYSATLGFGVSSDMFREWQTFHILPQLLLHAMSSSQERLALRSLLELCGGILGQLSGSCYQCTVTAQIHYHLPPRLGRILAAHLRLMQRAGWQSRRGPGKVHSMTALAVVFGMQSCKIRTSSIIHDHAKTLPEPGRRWLPVARSILFTGY